MIANKTVPLNLHHLSTLSNSAGSIPSINEPAPIVNLNTVKVHQTNDVYQHACNITAWQQLYDQLQPNIFKGQLTECWLEGIQFFKEYTNTSLRQSCIVWPKALWLGIPPPTGKVEGYIGSHAISQHTIALREGGSEFELTTPNDYTIMGLVVDLDVLLSQINLLYPEQQDQFNRFASNPTLQVNPEQKQRICQLIQQALKAGQETPELTTTPATLNILRQDLLENLINLLFSSEVINDKSLRKRENYLKIISKTRDYILSHPQDVITVASLCESLHVSRRTLQNCFQTVLGLSPYTYLKAIRLNAVRRELESRYSMHQTVQDAAMAWGFWHMSQFAIDYYSLFGELPSQSLSARGNLEHTWL